jgi:hypothetical protein
MLLLKSTYESLEKKIGKIIFPEADLKVGRKVTSLIIFALLSFYLGSKGGTHLGIILFGFGFGVVFVLFLWPALHRSSPVYLSIQGVYIRYDFLSKKEVFIRWGDIIKVEIQEKTRSILVHDNNGGKYSLDYYSGGRIRTKSKILFKPVIECLKKFRPDIEVSYIKYDVKDYIEEIKVGAKASPWFVIIGVIIFILILVNQFIELDTRLYFPIYEYIQGK